MKCFASAVLSLSLVSAPVSPALAGDGCGHEKAAAGTTASQNDVVDIAIGSKDHTTLVAAVKAAGLVDTLKSAGPFTVFAPTNAAFAKLPAGAVESLIEEKNKPRLTAVLTYHVVAGNIDSKTLVGLIKKNKGKATVKTVQGGTLPGARNPRPPAEEPAAASSGVVGPPAMGATMTGTASSRRSKAMPRS